MSNKTILLTAALVLTGAAALAQYSVNWFKIAGGGGTSSGGSYALSGTIGQADAVCRNRGADAFEADCHGAKH